MKQLYTLIGFLILASVNPLSAQTGRVGIGESSPGSKGSIKGNLSVGSAYSSQPAPTDGAIIQGRVGIGTNSPNSGAALDVQSNDKGILIPRVASTAAITSPTDGMMIYNTTTKKFNYYDGSDSQWKEIGSGSGGVTGPTGAKGDTGATGDKGDTGAQGIQGPAGAQGAQGIQGITGVTGDQGLQGIQGPAGAQGIQGIQGPVGPQGAQGTAGTNGTNGVTGATGLLSAGVTGATPYFDGTNWVTNSTNIYNNGGNVGIGMSAAPASNKLEVNGSTKLAALNQGVTTTERFYPNIISDKFDNTIAGAWIINTPIPRNSHIMFTIRVHGYGYGNSDVVDFTVSGYAYGSATGNIDGAAGAVINYKLSDVGTDGYEKYVGINSSGNVAVAFGNASSSSYFYRLAADAWITRSTADYSTGWSITQSTTSNFGWGDKNGPLTSTLKNSIHITPTGNIRLQNYTGGTLQVDGSGNVSVGAGSNVFTAGTGLSWSGNTLNSVWTASGNNISNNNSGNVGIGAAAGNVKLRVTGDIEATGQIRATGWLTGSGTGQGAEIGVSSGYSYFFGYNRTTSAYTPLRVVGSTIDLRHSDAASDLFINTSGNVGIGNSSPTQKLDVSGNINTSGHISQGPLIAHPNVTWSAGGTSTGAVIIKLPGTIANYGMLHMQIDVYEYGSTGVTTYYIGGHNWNGFWYNYNCHTVGNSNKKIRLAIKDNQYAVVLGEQGSSWSYGHVVLSKITNGGYYSGIINLAGAYSVTQDNAAESYTWISADLNRNVLESGNGSTNYLARWTSPTTLGTGISYDNGSSVGIGTASPSVRFHVSGGGAIIGTNSSGSSNRTLTVLNDGQAQINFGSYPYDWSPAIQIQNNDNTKMLWLSPGGSGTYSANNARMLANNTGLDFFTGANAFAATITSNGNVGIAETNPQEKLDVNGNILYNGLLKENTSAPTTYEVTTKRYHASSRYGTSGRTSIPLDMTIINELCGDRDGCVVRLFMRKWSAETQTAAATRGPYVLTYNAADGRWRANDNEGRIGFEGTQHAFQWWDCYLTDGRYTSGTSYGDLNDGLALLNWNSDYTYTNKTCEITFED